ncbi:hypothetical protein JCM1840_003145 [Sporobolomyces johnsonii]
MQFPKARRFAEPPPSQVPGPGAYNPLIDLPDPAYKKGPLGVQQSERFREGAAAEGQPDNFGMYNVDGAVGDKENLQPRRRAVSGQAVGGSTSASERERHKQQLEDLRHRLTTSHEKDVAKLQGKISRLEASRDELVKDKNESSKEAQGLKSEIRHLTSKLAKTESLLTKHQSSLPLLQSKLTSLQASHESSRQRKDAELADIAAKLADVEAALQRKTEELSAERERADGWETSAKREGKARRDEAEAAEKVIRGLRDEVREARVIALQAERLRRVKLARQLDDRLAQVGALAEYSQGLEETVSLLSEQLEALNTDYSSLLELWRSDRTLLVGERNEKEWRQRARSDAREMTGLREDVGELEEIRECERMCERDGEQVWRLRRREWNDEKERMKVDYEVVEGELDLAVNEEIPRLESLLSTANTDISTLQDRLIEQSDLITSLENDISSLQQRAVDDTERWEGELEEQKRVTEEKEKEAEKERAEKRRVIGILAQSRAAEAAYKEEAELLSSELDKLAPLRDQQASLHQTIDHLARLNAATEADVQQLMDQNSELVGHGNANQKIRHVAMLREELAESRRKHLATTSALAAAEQRVASLESELSSYRAVPSSAATPSSTTTTGLMLPPPVPFSRSRVTRPSVSDAVVVPSSRPLDPPPPVVITTHSSSTSSVLAPSQTSLRPASALSYSLSTSRRASRVFAFEDDPPLLPPLLAKSASSASLQPAQPPPFVRAANRPERRKSTSVKMEGRMSVSELFN